MYTGGQAGGGKGRKVVRRVEETTVAESSEHLVDRALVVAVWTDTGDVFSATRKVESRDNGLYLGQGNFDNLAVNGGGGDPCQTETVLAVIHLLEGRMRTMTGFGMLLSLAKWCSTSDIYGRKLLLQVGLAGIATCVMIGWFAASRYNQFGSNVYYLEVVALTLMPAGQVINTAIFAYIADVTEKQNRSLMCGYLVTSMALGGLIGSTISTYIWTLTGDLTVPLRITLILIALLAVYISILPESLRYSPASSLCISSGIDDASGRGVPDSTATSPWAIWNFFNLAKEATCMIFDPILLILPGRAHKSAHMALSAAPAIILLVRVLTFTANYGANSLLSSMAKLVFHWNVYEDGHYHAFVQLCVFITFLGIFPALLSIYKAVVMKTEETEELCGSNDSSRPQESLLHHSSDLPLTGISAVKMDMFFIVFGLCIMIFGFLIVPIFPSIPVLYLAGATNSLAVISSVSCIAVMSSIVPSDMIGAAYGAYSVSEGLGGVIADFTYGSLFVKTMKTSPIFYYYVSAGLCTIA
ncbi:MFS general substrate transporter, partial [Linnemannia elongata AG-77]